MRSKLFVPGARPDLFGKALASGADAVSIDLEDAVQEGRKSEARAATTDFVRSCQSPTPIIVRVNAVGTDHFAADVEAIAWPGLYAINLPKCESANDIRALAEALRRLEAARGLAEPIGILPTIESPRGLRLATEIATAHPRVLGLQLGLGDLFAPLGIDRALTPAVQAAQLAVRLAAGEAGIWALDTAFTKVADIAGYRSEAEHARQLGFIGKSCIHPSQVPIANDVFRPSAEQIARAVRIVEAWRAAQREGVGALLVDGHMIDLPFAREADALVARARGMGLL
ncbi:MAG: CoA ester lyase [Chloroflexota bacterium]|nr:CoA ester lyase [Chloroflexota bacterium]